ncbi:hypothetical protein L596_006529 [Steinernema carpocapsae]|uniref:Uncharacterized protein n=1 Tax=Steinernema carpocapsae TaxID=34508 RepID=A0A4U8V9I0_STECR|nr:hypothetical protein L596_006529 [Steinernema carpocapsae]
MSLPQAPKWRIRKDYVEAQKPKDSSIKHGGVNKKESENRSRLKTTRKIAERHKLGIMLRKNELSDDQTTRPTTRNGNCRDDEQTKMGRSMEQVNGWWLLTGWLTVVERTTAAGDDATSTT